MHPIFSLLVRPFLQHKPWAAFAVSVATHPFAGMFYLGRWKRALLYGALSALSIPLEFYLIGWPSLPFFFIDTVIIRLIGATDAARIGPAREAAWYMRWYMVLVWWGVQVMLVAGMIQGILSLPTP